MPVTDIDRRAIGSLTAAFADDPFIDYLIPDRDPIKRGWFFEKTLRVGQLYGRVDYEDGGRGVAVWLAPGRTTLGNSMMLRSGFWQAIFRLGSGFIGRMSAVTPQVDRLHHTSAPDPHWYLLGLGVDPAAQGRGLGSRLIERGQAVASAQGLPIYLETMTPENVAYYTNRGLRQTGSFTVPDAFTVWGFRADPDR